MSYLSFVVLGVPAVIGLVVAAMLGPNRGLIIGAVATLLVVFVLLLLQVTPPPQAEGGRASFALGLMRFEAWRWLPAFLVGGAIGSLIFRSRARR